jgi:hypothetical protein
MTDSLPPILGADIPAMIGRENLAKHIWNDLTSTNPSNLSIVGPRFIGKSVLLKNLDERATTDARSPYSLVIFWHLGHVCPQCDAEFIAQICDRLRDVMGRPGADYAAYRNYLETRSYANLKEITDLLDADGKRILMLWDGFDKPLGQGRLSGHLWDQMRDVFYGKGHRIVVVTRAPLVQLIRREDAITSPFWNIFDMPPTRVQVFDESDQTIACSQAGLTFTQGGKKELLNWTAGYPPLFLAVLKRLATDGARNPIDNDVVTEAAKCVANDFAGVLTTLWEDCPVAAREAYRLLVEKGEVAEKEVGREESECLLASGFASRAGNKLRSACRILEHHVQNRLPDTGSMTRLFGTWEAYLEHICTALELRLKQIATVNTRLHRLIEMSIADIRTSPDDCLNNLSQIEDVALDLIWGRELGSSKGIPNDIVAYWTVAPREKARFIAERMDSSSPRFNDWKLPSSRSDQVGFLQLLTGSTWGFDNRAKYVSKDTYVLVNAIHSFRNRNQHAEGQRIHEGVAVAAMMTCLELLGCLSRELS